MGFRLLVIDDPFVWFPNVLGLGSGIAQLALFAKYGFHTENILLGISGPVYKQARWAVAD